MENYIPPDQLWPGRYNFSSYAAGVLFLLNTINTQSRNLGGFIHNSYRDAYELDFVKYLKQVNISQNEYHFKTKIFYRGHYGIRVYAVPTKDAFTEYLYGVNGPISCILFDPFEEDLDSDYDGTIIGAEVRMLMPALRPLDFGLQAFHWEQYNLTVYDSNTQDKVSEHKIWLNPTKRQWVSIKNRNLTNLFKYFHRKMVSGENEDVSLNPKWQINITGIPIYPVRSYLNLVMSDLPLKCAKRYSPSCEKIVDSEQCDWRQNPTRDNVRCCRDNIPFDSEDVNIFSFDMSLLTANFYAPLDLNYTYCERNQLWVETNDCVPTSYKHKYVLTVDWKDPWMMILTNISDFEMVGCKCKDC